MKFDRKRRKRANKLHKADWAHSKAVFLDKQPDQSRVLSYARWETYAGEKGEKSVEMKCQRPHKSCSSGFI